MNLRAYGPIAHIISSSGFELRRHGGDFFIRKAGKFVCFLSFQPLEGKVFVEKMEWNPEADSAVTEIVRLLVKSGISMSFEFFESRRSV